MDVHANDDGTYSATYYCGWGVGAEPLSDYDEALEAAKAHQREFYAAEGIDLPI